MISRDRNSISSDSSLVSTVNYSVACSSDLVATMNHNNANNTVTLKGKLCLTVLWLLLQSGMVHIVKV